ncbi:hypothetical protein JKP88DRAFT_263270 [Tribonema minus]|uniref:C-type lectin domain-containing protein n=1 Tax=Tribonema minus TaxID=303371 RepID=A0A835YZU0_9STRA|nr:hypothetical protein JKP88DRAFT_263270 [Tribonema minus]
MWPGAIVAALIAPALLAARARAQTGTSAWLLRATQLQHYLTYEHTVQTIPLTATHNSYSSDYDPRTRAYFEVQANQIFDIPTQLRCLGTRGFEIDVHWLGSQAASDADASGLRVCHAGRGAAIYAYQLCTEMEWKKCNECGVEDFGPQSTICRRDAPTFGEVLQGIADWLDDPANAQEFLSVKLETRMNSPPGLLSQEIARVVGADRVYSAQDFEDDGGEWPTVASAVARGKQILFQSLNEVGALVLAYTEFAIKPAQIVDLCSASGPLCDDALYREAENTTGSTSSGLSLSDSGPPLDTICFRDVYRVQGDATALQFDAGGQTVFEYAFPPEDFLSAELVRPAQLCAFVPTFDRVDAALLASTVWSWAEGAPAAALPPPNTCAYVSAADGRWHDEPCRGGAARLHACVGGGGRGVWTATAAGGAGDARAVACGGGARFGAPRDAQENAALAQAVADAGVAEQASAGSAARAEAKQFEVEYRVRMMVLRFAGARERVLELLAAVRVATGTQTKLSKLKRALVLRTAAAHAWINVRTNAQGCWAAEGGRAYCVANGLVGSIPDESTCGAAPPPVPQQQREVCTNLDVPWNEFSYAAPSFSAPIAAEQMHEWPRVYGGNTWVLQPWYFLGCAYISIPFVCVGILVVVAMVAVEWHRSWRCCRRRGGCCAARGGSGAAAADAAKPGIGSGVNAPDKTVAEAGKINAGPGLGKPDLGPSKSGAGAGLEAEERRRSRAALLFAACCAVTFGASVVAVVGSAGANHQLVEGELGCMAGLLA